MIAFLVRQSIRYPGVIVALALTVIIYGMYVLTRANLDVFPEFSPSQVVIQTEAPGLSAELVERQVTQPIENALAGTSGVESVRSQSIPGLSVVTVVFRDGSDVYRNRQVVGERLGALANQLPRAVSQPTMTPLTSSASTVLGVGLTSKSRSLMDIRTLVDWTVRPHLMAVEGVADVNVFGGEVRQWQVQVDPDKLMRYGLTMDDVLEAARRASGVVSAGFLKTPNQHIFVDATAQPASVAELSRVLLAYRDGAALRLGEVGQVVEAPAASISAAAIDGTPGVFLMIQGQLGANTRAVTQDLERALQHLAPVFAAQKVEVNPRMFRPANFIETAVRQRAARLARRLGAGRGRAVPVLVQRPHCVHLHHRDSGLAAWLGHRARLLRRGPQHHGVGRPGDRAGRSSGRRHHRHGEHLPAVARESPGRAAAACAGRGVERLGGSAQLGGVCHVHRGAGVRAAAHSGRHRGQAVRAARARLYLRHPRVPARWRLR